MNKSELLRLRDIIDEQRESLERGRRGNLADVAWAISLNQDLETWVLTQLARSG